MYVSYKEYHLIQAIWKTMLPISISTPLHNQF
jgi:hypothetical protein